MRYKETMSKSINIGFPFNDSTDGQLFKMNTTTREAIKSDLVHLLLTKKGERLYLPKFGTNLVNYLFEPNDGKTQDDVRREIEQAISDFIPNLTLVNFVVENDEHVITAKIDYLIDDGALAITDSVSLTFNI